MSTSGATGSAERGRLGARLREARERRNLTLRAVAERTKIPVTNLDALENEQGQRLPGGIFARSFVRAYAREVGLDPEEAVREFVRANPEHAAPDGDTDEDAGAHHGTSTGGPGRVAAWLIAVAIVAAAGFAGYRWLQVPERAGPVAAPSVSVPPPAPAAPDTALRSGDQPETAPETVPEATGPAPDSGSTPVAAAEPDAEASSAGAVGAAATEPAATAPPPVQPVPAATPGVIRLEIHPTAPCWVRVSTDGRVRLERLVQPGERPVVVAADGIQLQVGDAGAFDYTINGQPGRSLGGAGRVVRVAISRDNLAEFVGR